MTRDQLERERSAVLAAYVKRRAAQYPDVLRLRKHLFGSAAETVSREQAGALLSSPGTQFLRKKDFEEYGILWREHSAKVESVKAGVTDEASWRDYTIRVRWPGGGHGRVFQARITLADAHGRGPRSVSLRGPRGETPYSVNPGTWLADVARAAESAATDLGWTIAEAAQFILTGEAPDLNPLRVELRRPSWGTPILVLYVQPHVDRRTLQAAYGTAQRQLDGPKAYRKRHRPVQQRALRLFDFVDQRIPFDLKEGRRRLKSWSQILAAWNRRYPAWRYAEHRTLRRDFERTRGLLVGDV